MYCVGRRGSRGCQLCGLQPPGRGVGLRSEKKIVNESVIGDANDIRALRLIMESPSPKRLRQSNVLGLSPFSGMYIQPVYRLDKNKHQTNTVED